MTDGAAAASNIAPHPYVREAHRMARVPFMGRFRLYNYKGEFLMFYTLDLPRYWAVVYFENGDMLNVANTDTLTETEARIYKKTWEHRGKIVKVTLETSGGQVLKNYDFL